MLSIADFITHVKKAGLQKVNRFGIVISIPDGVLEQFNGLVGEIDRAPPGFPDIKLRTRSDSTANDISRTLSLMAGDVSKPGYNVSSTEMHVGTTRKIAYDRTTGDFNVTFRCSGNMAEQKLFDAWMKYMFRANHSVAFYDDYVSPSIQILTLDQANNVTYQCSVSEAYPAVVTELTLNNEGTDSILTFQVTFNYRKVFNSDEDYGAKENSAPLVFDGLVDLPQLNEFSKPLALPNAPALAEGEAFVSDIFNNINKVKSKVEDGSLSAEAGKKLITQIARDVGSSSSAGGVVDKAMDYASEVTSALGRFG